MLIRSKNKAVICNLDNLDCVRISESYNVNTQETTSEIYACNQEEKILLGYYLTEERAIEVLEEICNFYISLNEYRYNNNLFHIEGFTKNGVYQMPAE